MSQDMHGYMARSICLRQQDLYRYAEVLREPHFIPAASLCPGRGYVRVEERIVEFMTMQPDRRGTT